MIEQFVRAAAEDKQSTAAHSKDYKTGLREVVTIATQTVGCL